jgi:RNA polymerase sigma-70 factor, ECF subfamily
MAMSLTFSPEFLEQLQNQDRAAFTILVQKSHFRLLGFTCSIAGRELAEDIMQDAWVAIWRGLPGFEGRASLSTWLYTVVRNECAARLKKEGRVIFLPPPMEAGNPLEDWMESRFAENGQWQDAPPQWALNSPEAILEEQDLMDCLERNLGQLKESQQAVFRLRELEQFSAQEVCNILELSHSNVRVLLHRARLKLLQVIDQYQMTGEC